MIYQKVLDRFYYSLCDPVHCNIDIKDVDTLYIIVHNFLDALISDGFSVLNLKMRSMNKNFENFKNLLADLK